MASENLTLKQTVESCLTYSSTLKIFSIRSFDTLMEFCQTSLRYNLDDRIFIADDVDVSNMTAIVTAAVRLDLAHSRCRLPLLETHLVSACSCLFASVCSRSDCTYSLFILNLTDIIDDFGEFSSDNFLVVLQITIVSRLRLELSICLDSAIPHRTPNSAYS